MKIAIVGSRDFKDKAKVVEYVTSLDKDDWIISGGARGVDRWAEETAKLLNMRFTIYHADWDTYGKRAGFLRNIDIVKQCDRLVAFWDGKSKGTEHSINLAKTAGKPVEIIIVA